MGVWVCIKPDSQGRLDAVRPSAVIQLAGGMGGPQNAHANKDLSEWLVL